MWERGIAVRTKSAGGFFSLILLVYSLIHNSFSEEYRYHQTFEKCHHDVPSKESKNILPVKLWAKRSKRTSDDFLDPPGLLLVLPFKKINLDFVKHF
jgi:hypothetical protein